ncbi:MAG: nucleotidyltransferase family protein [Mycobacteriales bacterium]
MIPAGLVLAAGAGTRLGRPKALVTVHGETLVERAVRTLTAAGCGPVLTVLGAQAEQVLASVYLPFVAVNPGWERGMGTSLLCGLRALPGDAEAVVVALADQPLVGSEAVVRLIAAWREGAVAAVATYAGKPRNPVLLARSLWTDIEGSLGDDRGAGPWLREHPDVVTLVPCDGTGSPYDVDTPDDLQVVQRSRS